MIHESDMLRSPETIGDPDSRTLSLVRVNRETGERRQIMPSDQHSAISEFVLNATVPEQISIHFETAKNLYLYAWFVFRFYPVAEQQAFSCLEFSLRERQPEFVKEYVERHHRNFEPGLHALLRNAIEEGLVENAAFRSRERWALGRAIARLRYEMMDKMTTEGLNEMSFDYENVSATIDDLNHDWLSDFLETIPELRNEYAHGSGMLYHTVLHTFEVVSELVNQLYPRPNPQIP